MILAETDRGVLIFEGNELFVRSKDLDPPKVRMQSTQGGGTVSFDKVDANGRVTELTFFRGANSQLRRDDPNDTSGLVDIFIRDAQAPGDDDQQMLRAFTMDADLVPTFERPVQPSSGGGGGTGPAGPPGPVGPAGPAGPPGAPASVMPAHMIRSPNGRFLLNMQDDGNLVIYQNTSTPDDPLWVATWDSGPHLP